VERNLRKRELFLTVFPVVILDLGSSVLARSGWGVVFVALDPSNRAIFVFIKSVECGVGQKSPKFIPVRLHGGKYMCKKHQEKSI
jgi:hypothetical protein